MAEVEYGADPDTETAIIEAISGILRERRHEILNRGIIILEVMDEDGDRGLWIAETQGMATWDEEALLGYALRKVHDVDLMRRWRAGGFPDPDGDE